MPTFDFNFTAKWMRQKKKKKREINAKGTALQCVINIVGSFSGVC